MPDLPVNPGTGYARVNWSRWIVDCATPYCRGAMAVFPGSPDAWCCDCGQMTHSIAWPADIEGVEAVLSMRPDWTTRNWEPGETLYGLMLENAQHGHLPELPEGQHADLMITVNDRVAGGMLLDMLPSAEQRKMVGA